jgi:hypothetical protein
MQLELFFFVARYLLLGERSWVSQRGCLGQGTRVSRVHEQRETVRPPYTQSQHACGNLSRLEPGGHRESPESFRKSESHGVAGGKEAR